MCLLQLDLLFLAPEFRPGVQQATHGGEDIIRLKHLQQQQQQTQSVINFAL
jgi:hypothetical protein